jgi:hypothetical protein
MTLFPWEEEPRPKKKRRSKDVIRSDTDNVHRQDEWVREREKERAKRIDVPMRSRRYRPGPEARPDWPCNGGLPSLGKDQ